jgi:hypothetical protein
LYPAWPWCAERETESNSNPATTANELNSFFILTPTFQNVQTKFLQRYLEHSVNAIAHLVADYIIAISRVSMLLKGY